MLVTLNRRDDGDGLAVHVTGPGISGAATWCGRGDPVVEVPVDVELDVPEVIAWNKVAVESSGDEPPVPEPGELFISGVVEHEDEDGVAVIRVADSTVLLETAGARPSGVTGEQVALVARDVGIYPTGA